LEGWKLVAWIVYQEEKLRESKLVLIQSSGGGA
jgi:hypothetical protein